MVTETSTGRAGGLCELRDRLEAEGLRLVRSWPRDAGHLLLHLRDVEGGHDDLAGQWFADDTRAAHVAAGSSGPRRAARHLTGTGTVLQSDGADRRLLGLGALLERPGAQLVSHRAERRAVVRHEHPQYPAQVVYSKVVRPSRADALARTSLLSPPGVRVPSVSHVDLAAGVVSTEALPGRTLHDLCADHTVPGRERLRAGRGTGAAVAALHAGPVSGSARHGVEQELRITRAWLRHAAEHASMAPQVLQRLHASTDLAARALAEDRGAEVLLHRDLHDKQVVVEPSSDALPALLDLDCAARGEAALDVANLVVHFWLRDLQDGRTDAAAAVGAFLHGYGQVPAADRVRGFAVLSAVRLVAVHSFRGHPDRSDGPRRIGPGLVDLVRAALA